MLYATTLNARDKASHLSYDVHRTGSRETAWYRILTRSLHLLHPELGIADGGRKKLLRDKFQIKAALSENMLVIVSQVSRFSSVFGES